MPVVHLDGCGVIGSWHVYNESDGARVSDREDRMGQLNAYIQMFGAAVAARNFPVDRFIVGAINEYGGGRNEDWQPDRFRWNGYLRAAMPNHTIVDGPANWKDPRALWNDQGIGSTPFVKWSDANNIIDCHHYLPSRRWTCRGTGRCRSR